MRAHRRDGAAGAGRSARPPVVLAVVAATAEVDLLAVTDGVPTALHATVFRGHPVPPARRLWKTTGARRGRTPRVPLILAATAAGKPSRSL
ncbi:hypothetical protein GCM10010106_01770 [Thermopolyspora flexuosa]|nr:hypothetical protein GCM10010106_01770 [Thermopolyspora flexuosa]